VHADAAARAVFALSPTPLMLADAAALAVIASSPQPLMFADAAALAVFTKKMATAMVLGTLHSCLICACAYHIARQLPCC